MASSLTSILKIAPASMQKALLGSHALALFLFQYSEKKENIYNLLWVVVFGFATLNILGLVARRLEPTRNRMNFGEILAIAVVVIAVILLGWEMLYLFRILPIKLEPR
jgi:hypothetical protein